MTLELWDEFLLLREGVQRGRRRAAPVTGALGQVVAQQEVEGS